MPTKRRKRKNPTPHRQFDATAKARAAADAGRTIRETVESIAVAFVLAFLFRTFEAEAFVIPTGSMAPTLQGRHKDLVCPGVPVSLPGRAPAAKRTIRCNAHGHLSNPSVDARERERQRAIRDKDVVRHLSELPLSDGRRLGFRGRKWPAYNGDRILVAKFPYDFADPERWDVVVFRYPGNAADELHQAAGRPPARNGPHSPRRHLHPAGRGGATAQRQRAERRSSKSPASRRTKSGPWRRSCTTTITWSTR